MNKTMTLTDKLLIVSIGISFLAAVFHPTLPAIVCTVIHLAVTGLATLVHLAKKDAEPEVEMQVYRLDN